MLRCKKKKKTESFPKLAKCNQITTKLTLETKRNGAEKGQISYWQYHSGKYPRTKKSCQVEEKKINGLPKNSQAQGTGHSQQLEGASEATHRYKVQPYSLFTA